MWKQLSLVRKLGLKKEDVDLGRATLVVSIYWLLLLALPYIFDQYAWLLVITIALSFFEAFIHTVGIVIHHMKKSYTPGLVSAWLLAVVAVIAIIQLNTHSMVSIGGYMIGTVLMILSFICMDIVIILGFEKSFQILSIMFVVKRINKISCTKRKYRCFYPIHSFKARGYEKLNIVYLW